jgi:hypothetical protein
MRFLLIVIVGLLLGGCAHESIVSALPMQEAQAIEIATKAAEEGDWHVTRAYKAEQHKGGWNVFVARIHERHEAEFAKVVISSDGKAMVWPMRYIPSVNESLQRPMQNKQLR